MKYTALAIVVVGTALGIAFRQGAANTTAMWLELGVPYLALSGLALRKLHQDGVLLDMLRPRAGDFSIGAVIAAALWAGGWLVRHFVLTDT